MGTGVGGGGVVWDIDVVLLIMGCESRELGVYS